MEAEYIALVTAAKEGIWLRRLENDLFIKTEKFITIHEDNQYAIKTAKNPIQNDRSKHIDVRYHFIRDKVMDGTILLKYCPTTDMTADVLTKPLQRNLQERHAKAMGLSPSH